MKLCIWAATSAVLATGNIVAEGPSAPVTVANYQVSVVPENIAPTPLTQPNDNIQVFGQPRNSIGHPCTLLDKQDVDDLKKNLTTNPDLQKAFAALKTSTDARIAQPLNVPVPEKAPDSSWLNPRDFPANVSPFGKPGHTNSANSSDMADLGMMYQLSGDEKYGEFCKKMLLAYADGFNNYGHPKGWTETKYRSAQDGRLTGEFLGDGFWLCEAAYAYDMVSSLPSWTPAERAHIRDDLFKAIAAEFSNPIQAPPDYLSSKHNRSAICTSGVLMAGYATEDETMINNALYGTGGTKDAPKGGLLQVHFGEECLLPDGLWNEGAPGYQLGIASCGLFNDAETLWHHGIDMYRYRGGVLKRLLDSAIALAYPDDKMTIADLHDSSRFELLDDRLWLNNELGVPYECGYLRYHDPSYIPIIQNADKTLSMTIHSGGPSLFLDLPPANTIPPRPIENANFYSVGYGVLRLPAAGGANQLIQEYGLSGSHGHPSKLGIDLYALGDTVMPFPGVIFPYNNPLDAKWYETTLGNCTMAVDEQSQIYFHTKFKFKDLPDPDAIQLIFGPASTMGIERAWSNTVYAGVTQDRALFLTPNYLADIFGAFSTTPHKYDLAWHIRGSLTTTLKADPFQFPEPVADGYNSITNLTHANTDQAWSATLTTPNNQTVRFLAAGGTPTDVYLGNGHYFAKKKTDDEAPPIIVQRRADQNNALFGNAADISGTKTGYLKSVTQEGSLDTGYGLLKVETVKGTDLCFSSFRPGTYTADGMSTDAMQAMVQMDGANVTALYLAGGTSLKVPGGTITRSVPGLVYVEKTAKGSYIVGNPSAVEAFASVALPALKGLKPYVLDDQGKQTGPAEVKSGADGTLALHLKASSQIEFAP